MIFIRNFEVPYMGFASSTYIFSCKIIEIFFCIFLVVNNLRINDKKIERLRGRVDKPEV